MRTTFSSRSRRALACALLCAAAFGPARTAVAAAGSTVRVSLTSAGAQASDISLDAGIAGAGRYVVFDSVASNLVAGDTNQSFDVFLRDRVAGTTERLSVGSGGIQADSDSLLRDSAARAISDDGSIVVFRSTATNLVSGDTNGVADVFVRDRLAGTTTRIGAGSAPSAEPTLSADGRYVAFESRAPLVAGDTNGVSDIYRYDRTTSQLVRVSLWPGGAQTAEDSYAPATDATGNLITFSTTDAMVPADVNTTFDVYLRDVAAGTTTLISRATGGNSGDFSSYQSSVSPDGRYVAYSSEATDLVPGDTNLARDIFLFDRQTATTSRVSVSSPGAQADDKSSYVSVTSGAQTIVFSSDATNLVAGDTNGEEDVFIRDRLSGITRRVSIRPDTKVQGDHGSYAPTVSNDGSLVAYVSDATNLVANDSNDAGDIFVSEPDTIGPGAPTISTPAEGALFASASVTIAGTAEVYSTVEIKEGTTVLATATAAANGAWSVSRTFGDGPHTIAVTAIDLAGNVGTQAARTFTIDTIPPAPPTIGSPGQGSVQLTSPVTISGTAETGSTVTVREGASTLATVVASTGSWSATVTLGEGAHAVVARARDAAGNTSADSATRSFTVDALPPGAPVIASPAQGAATNARPLTITGSAEPASTVQVKEGATVIGSAVAAGNGAWSLSASLIDGSHSISAVATDVHGRSGPASALRTFTVDTIAPGTSAIDSPANDALVPTTFTVAGQSEASTNVRLYDGVSVVRITTSDATGAWSASITLTNGTHNLTARAVDAAGNLGAASPVVRVVVDGTGPNVSFRTQNNAVISSMTETQIAGTAVDANGVARIEVGFVDLLGNDLGTVVADCSACGVRSGSSVSWTVDAPEAVGPVTVRAQAVDLVGNRSAARTITIIRA